MAQYQPDSTGDSIAAVRGNAVLLLPATAVSDALWSALASDDAIAAVLDTVTAHGLGSAPPFALAVRDENDTVRVVVRGDYVVDVDAVRIAGRGVSTFAEQTFEASATVVIARGGVSLDGQRPFGEELPVVEAMVAAQLVRSSAREVLTPGTGEVMPPRLEGQPASIESTITPIEETIAPSDDGIDEETVVGVSVPARPLPPFAASAPAAPAASAGPEAPGTSASTEHEAGDHDGLTIAGPGLDQLRAERAAQTPVAPPSSADTDPDAGASSGAPTRVRLRLPGGAVETIDDDVIVGRAPSPGRVSGLRLPKLVTIGEGDPDISRSHVRLAIEGDTVVVTDLDSRNGTTILAPGRAPMRLRAGEPVPVLVGTTIDLGEGWTMQLEAD